MATSLSDAAGVVVVAPKAEPAAMPPPRRAATPRTAALVRILVVMIGSLVLFEGMGGLGVHVRGNQPGVKRPQRPV
ncbi:hypothetical protein GCM10023168_06480 [Fodinibacter luteus]|uniref:Uncharacterized protein n=1 Tax=Fodinibacter luteus TaxID=552064 RepID=A0ABP8K2H3_9MICO